MWYFVGLSKRRNMPEFWPKIGQNMTMCYAYCGGVHCCIFLFLSRCILEYFFALFDSRKCSLSVKLASFSKRRITPKFCPKIRQTLTMCLCILRYRIHCCSLISWYCKCNCSNVYNRVNFLLFLIAGNLVQV